MQHELKTWSESFQSMARGEKKHEIRDADRPFAVGDTLLLREYDPATERYTGNVAEYRVTYVTPGGEWGIPPGKVVMSVAPKLTGGACPLCATLPRP